MESNAASEQNLEIDQKLDKKNTLCKVGSGFGLVDLHLVFSYSQIIAVTEEQAIKKISNFEKTAM